MLQTDTHTIESFDSEKLFARTWQNASHPDTVFVFTHGLAGDHVAYQPLIELLCAQIPECLCIAYDLRGHGQSSFRFPTSERSLYNTYAHDLQAICQFFKVKHPILVGQSLAGMVLQTYLESKLQPQPIAQILISSGLQMPFLGISLDRSYSWLAAASQNWQFQPRIRTQADHQHFKGSWDYSPRRIATDIYFTHLKKYLLVWMAAFGWQAQAPYVANSPETLYLFGKKDVVIPPFIQYTNLKQLPQVTWKEIDSNHNAIVNSPELLVPEIVSFTKRFERARSEL